MPLHAHLKSDQRYSAPGVHLISWRCRLRPRGVNFLYSLGMKYPPPICRLLALMAIFALACATPASAQAQSYASSNATLGDYPASAAPSEDEPQSGGLLTIHKRVDEVNVLFIATDKHGKFVRDLNQGDFTILDDHKPPQSILNFRRETDLPLHLGLLIDVSGSVHGRFDFEQNAPVNFLQHSPRASFDKAFIVGFNNHSTMTQDFTDNGELLSTGVHKLQDGGGTALYDAIYRASKEKFLKDRPERPVRK